MSRANQAPWLAAWRAWMGLAATTVKNSAGTANPRAAADAGFAQAYVEFARVVQQILKHGGNGDFASRLVGALQAAGRTGSGSAAGNDVLNAFLRAAPSALLAVSPDANAGQAWLQWTATLQKWSTEWLALPALGAQREWQEMLQAVQRATLAEQVARARVDEHYRLATRTALERFGRFLQDDNGAPITTVRALYDAWIDQAEAAYAERVMGDRYTRDFGAWVNAGSDVRLALRALGGRVSALLDTPGRDEIDALNKRLHELQRELAALRAAAPALVAEPPSKSPPAPSVARPLAQIPTKKMAKTPRAATPKVRKREAGHDEFDISHILDVGK